jgi:hypothetical protein
LDKTPAQAGVFRFVPGFVLQSPMVSSALGELRKMLLGVTVRAKQNALGQFFANFASAAIGKRTHVQFEPLLRTIDVVPRQRCVISIVPAASATTAGLLYQFEFSARTPCLLRDVILMAVICIGVLAPSRTILALSAAKQFSTNAAKVRSGHIMRKIIIRNG